MLRIASVVRLLLPSLLILLFGRTGHAITSEEFRLRSGADLVALCSTPQSDPLYSAAIHMCHGYGAGVYQAIIAITSLKQLDHAVCPPDPPPTRNEGVRMFLEWANGPGASHLSEPAVDTLGRFLLAKFPCTK